MRRLIDGHVHIRPCHPEGWTDPMTGNTILKYGKMRTADGGVRQILPSYVSDTAFPVETLIEVLNEHKVDKAAVMAHLDSEICETAVDAMKKYPDRLAAAISLVPEDRSVEELKRWNAEGIRILKFEMRNMYEVYPDITLTSPVMTKILDQAEKLGMVVVVDPSPSTFPSYRPDCMREAVESHPGIRFVICHMAFPVKGMRDMPELYSRWKQMIMLGKRDNVSFDVTAVPDLFLEENFPYPSAMDFLHEMYDLCGAEKLIWGTDIPGTFRTATYDQMVQAFERVTFLSEEEKDKMFYCNADRLYFKG